MTRQMGSLTPIEGFVNDFSNPGGSHLICPKFTPHVQYHSPVHAHQKVVDLHKHSN